MFLVKLIMKTEYSSFDELMPKLEPNQVYRIDVDNDVEWFEDTSEKKEELVHGPKKRKRIRPTIIASPPKKRIRPTMVASPPKKRIKLVIDLTTDATDVVIDLTTQTQKI